MENADKPEDFITALVKLQEACGAADRMISQLSMGRESKFYGLERGASIVWKPECESSCCHRLSSAPMEPSDKRFKNNDREEQL